MNHSLTSPPASNLNVVPSVKHLRTHKLDTHKSLRANTSGMHESKRTANIWFIVLSTDATTEVGAEARRE